MLKKCFSNNINFRPQAYINAGRIENSWLFSMNFYKISQDMTFSGTCHISCRQFCFNILTFKEKYWKLSIKYFTASKIISSRRIQIWENTYMTVDAKCQTLGQTINGDRVISHGPKFTRHHTGLILKIMKVLTYILLYSLRWSFCFHGNMLLFDIEQWIGKSFSIFRLGTWKQCKYKYQNHSSWR